LGIKKKAPVVESPKNNDLFADDFGNDEELNDIDERSAGPVANGRGGRVN